MLGDPASAEEVARCVRDAVAICEIPAPTGDEARRAAWVAERLGDAGLRVEIDANGSVLARPRDAAPGAIVVAAHLDTVFAGVGEITVRRDGDVLHGPGIGDNALGLAGLLFLARRWGAGVPAGRPVVLAATVGEEGLGNLRGARGVVEALAPAELIALEGGGARQLVTQGVGSARVVLRAQTPGGHSWQDRGRPSALHVLIALLAPLAADPRTASFNVGELHGGAGINVLAPAAHATVEFRDLDTARLDAAVQRLVAAARGAASREIDVHVDVLGRRPGGVVPAEHPLVRDAVAALEAAGAGTPALVASSTDANAALAAGIPAVTVGLADTSGVHSAQERVDVSPLPGALSALARLVARRAAA
jgi:acetylornithine deacetylase/succinyl-diaminopimelate desuccinylase-like protein